MSRILAPPRAPAVLAFIAAFAAAGGTHAAAQGAYTRVFERATTFASEFDGVWALSSTAASGLPDLVFVKTANTPSGRVEVHVAPGATQYQTRGLEVPTTFANETGGVWGLVAGTAALPDLYFIKTANTPSGHVEVHIASAASNYQARTVETATTFANETDGVWALVRSAGGGLPDLVFVKTSNTPSGRVEVHVASGASRYQARVLEVPTTFAVELDGTWGVVADPAGSFPDLYFIKTANTPSGNVEVHIASAASRYQARTLEVATDFRNETGGAWSLLPNLPRTQVPGVAFIKTANTPNGHVEVHLAQFGTR
ncbi:MAG: hypothetical protein ACJ8GN_14225 [Longimicrobiaceae bacterium]